MRDLYVESVEGNYAGCCGIQVIHGFNTTSSKKPITDEEWYTVILTKEDQEWDDNFGFADILEPNELLPIVTFAHASSQTGPFSPKKFAAWLISKGETVVEGPTATNRPYHKITPYFWAPSEKFKASVKAFCAQYNNKKKVEAKEDAGTKRGTVAA